MEDTSALTSAQQQAAYEQSFRNPDNTGMFISVAVSAAILVAAIVLIVVQYRRKNRRAAAAKTAE